MTPTTPLMRANELTRHLPGQLMLAFAGTVFIAIAAQISVPFFPVPLTLQTLAILIVGLTFGSRLGAATLIAYLAEGAAGLPVFANGNSFAAFTGPTAGFLIGFVGVAWIAGFAVEKGLARGFVSTAIVGIVASLLLYIPGAAWPMAVSKLFSIDASWVGASSETIWLYFMKPFLIGDATKAIIAALLVVGGRNLLTRR